MKRLLVLVLLAVSLMAIGARPIAARASGEECKADADCKSPEKCQNSASGHGICCADGSTCLVNPIHVTTLPGLVNNIISVAVGMVGALALLVFIYGGLRWLTSAGEPAKIQAGKDAMKWASVGLVVVFTSYALVSFVIKALTG